MGSEDALSHPSVKGKHHIKASGREEVAHKAALVYLIVAVEDPVRVLGLSHTLRIPEGHA